MYKRQRWHLEREREREREQLDAIKSYLYPHSATYTLPVWVHTSPQTRNYSSYIEYKREQATVTVKLVTYLIQRVKRIALEQTRRVSHSGVTYVDRRRAQRTNDDDFSALNIANYCS